MPRFKLGITVAALSLSAVPLRRCGLFLATFVEESRRANAAARRYDELRGPGASACHRRGIGRDQVARRVFDEFYGSLSN